jgi:hypothetical protein
VEEVRFRRRCTKNQPSAIARSNTATAPIAIPAAAPAVSPEEEFAPDVTDNMPLGEAIAVSEDVLVESGVEVAMAGEDLLIVREAEVVVDMNPIEEIASPVVILN